MSDYVKCENCKYEDNCPAGWSYCNAACLTIQREKEDCQKGIIKKPNKLTVVIA